MSYDLQNVKGDGSCFFRALYQSAKEYDHLDTVLGAFQHEGRRFCEAQETMTRTTRTKRARIQNPTDPEEAFATCARQFLQALIQDETAQYNYRDTLLRTSYLIRAVGSREAKSLFSTPMVRATFQSKSDEVFLKNMAQEIVKLTTYVNEAEVVVIQEMLAEHSVRLVVCTSPSGIEDAVATADDSTLILYCHDNTHYNWVKYERRLSLLGGRKKRVSKKKKAPIKAAQNPSKTKVKTKQTESKPIVRNTKQK
jgi:hypothetical protein